MFFLFAKTFSCQYAEFEIPADIECYLSGADWVCENIKKPQEITIIVTAKESDPKIDDISFYQAYLKNPKPGLKSSSVRYVKTTLIQNHPWVDSLHLGSEIKDYYTRYLVTTKDNLAVGIVFTVKQELYNFYEGLISGTINSIKVFKKKDPVGKMIFNAPSVQEKSSEDDAFKTVPVQETKKETQNTSSMITIIGFIVILYLGFRIYKKRQGM